MPSEDVRPLTPEEEAKLGAILALVNDDPEQPITMPARILCAAMSHAGRVGAEEAHAALVEEVERLRTAQANTAQNASAEAQEKRTLAAVLRETAEAAGVPYVNWDGSIPKAVEALQERVRELEADLADSESDVIAGNRRLDDAKAEVAALQARVRELEEERDLDAERIGNDSIRIGGLVRERDQAIRERDADRANLLRAYEALRPMQDWPADTVLGEGGVQAVDDALGAVTPDHEWEEQAGRVIVRQERRRGLARMIFRKLKEARSEVAALREELREAQGGERVQSDRADANWKAAEKAEATVAELEAEVARLRAWQVDAVRIMRADQHELTPDEWVALCNSRRELVASAAALRGEGDTDAG